MTNLEHILIVDDNDDTLQMISRKLKSRGWQVSTAQDVNHALPILENAGVELVLTIIRCPKLPDLI